MKQPERVQVESVTPRSSAKATAKLLCLFAVLLTISFLVIRCDLALQNSKHKAARIPAEDQAYFDALGPPINDSGPSMDALLDLYDAAQKNRSIVKTPDWQKKAKTACAVLDGQGKVLENAAPVPGDCLQTGKDAVLTGQQMRLVAATFLKAANPQSPSLDEMSQTTQQIDEVTRLSEIIADDANKIRAKYGVASTKPEPASAAR